MSILNVEDASTIAQVWAARISEEQHINAGRLENWQRRCSCDAVAVPHPVNPPSWPAVRAAIPIPENVTPIKRRKP